MGKGGNFSDEQNGNSSSSSETKLYSWNEIKESDKMIVINDRVYDVSKFVKRHPGGERLLKNHVAQDATDAFNAFHTDMNKVTKYMKTLEVGKVLMPPKDQKNNLIAKPKDDLIEDFRKLKLLAERMNLFKSSKIFFGLHFFQIVFLDLVATFLIHYGGYSNWYTYLTAVLALLIAQAQAGWLQHDFGHLSVFKSNKLNHLVHRIVIGSIKATSSDWWNFRHFQHHAKPNTIRKDPDIRFGAFLVLGKILPRELGTKKAGKLPYQYQQNYFFMIVPPLLLPLYFNFENTYFLFKTKKYSEFAWILSFFVRWYIQFGSVLGLVGTLALYVIVRFLESFWFVFTTQMSHLPMSIDRDQDLDWFRSQLIATCNVEQSWFNDWFSGHLNFQIEHHLFPTMPRHNYYKIAPHVKSLCAKYNIEYTEKTLIRAIADIYTSLKDSGELWYEAYNM